MSHKAALLAAIGEVIAECKRATGEDELIDREVGPRLANIIARAERALVPDGWQLVPVEPTEEMLDAACECDALGEVMATNAAKTSWNRTWASNGEIFRVRWREALLAAPKREDK